MKLDSQGLDFYTGVCRVFVQESLCDQGDQGLTVKLWNNTMTGYNTIILT